MKRIITLAIAGTLGCAAIYADYWYVNLKRVNWPQFVTVDQPFSMEFAIENNGSAPIESIDVTYSPNGGTAMTLRHVFAEAVAPGVTDTLAIDEFVCDVTGKEVFGRFTLTAVNGDANYGSDTYAYTVCGHRYIARNLVVEEATGTTCQYCPEGIVGMEHMRDTYPDGSWIGISVFNDSPMDMSDVYKSLFNRVSGTPTAIANRDYASNYRPSKIALEDLYQRMHGAAAMVGIKADVTVDREARTAMIDAQTYYAFDEVDAAYTLSYVITEDSVGPYYQYNAYSGQSIDMGGWESMAGVVKWIYNDVARPGSLYGGIEGSIPSQLSVDDTYNYSWSIDLSGVNNLDKASINVMVLNSAGQIENAVRRRVDGSQNDNIADTEPGQSVLTPTAAATETESELFDLQGRRVNSVSRPGVYIHRSPDGTARRVMLRQ